MTEPASWLRLNNPRRSSEPQGGGIDLTGELPARSIMLGLAATFTFLALFLGFGLLARLDAAVVASGKVVVFGNRKAVQHLEGGVVSELNVHEGDHVVAGQILARLDGAQALASERAVAAQVIELQAEQARIIAELRGLPTIDFPASFRTLPVEEAGEVAVAEALQQREFATRASALHTSVGVLRKKEGESAEQINGYQRQVAANRVQQHLIGEEITGLQGLLTRGLVPATRVRSLQRNAAELSGNEGEYGANIARAHQEIGETEVRISDLEHERAATDSHDYQTVQMQLSELEPKLVALQDVERRTVIRSPATGRVVNLGVFTVGGVVAPGQKLMEVVPEGQPLVIEATVKPQDAGDLRVGQPTEIRVPAFHDRGMPKILGRISTVSADAMNDEKSGAPFFRITVVVPASEAARIQARRNGANGLQPGLPVEIVVPLGRRTALGYIFEPLRQTLWRSFREH